MCIASFASICRHLECVKFLLSEDADPFLVDRAHLRTALHCAAAYGHAPVLRALLADDLVVSCWMSKPIRQLVLKLQYMYQK